MRTRVKICGITRQQDADFAVKKGADAIGLVFYDASPRSVTIAQAAAIVSTLPPFVSVVALFVDPAPQFVRQCLEALPIDILQFHGDESAEFCRQFNKAYIKAIRMKPGIVLASMATAYNDAKALLLDSYQVGLQGGTGKTFDWSIIPAIEKPIILAGGLTADNVAQAIQQVKPYAVDVSGGVEAAKGLKDNEKISAFMKEVAHA